MRAERLFRILGLVDESLIEEAVSASSPAAAQRRIPWRRLRGGRRLSGGDLGAAWRRLLSRRRQRMPPARPAAEPRRGRHRRRHHRRGGAATAFMSYAGPVFPLTTAEADTGLTAERTVTWDFALGAYEDGSPRQWGAQVTDDYVLTNPTDADVTVTALYPFAGSLADLGTIGTAVTVDGAETPYTLYAGPYAGGFRDAGVDDGSTWNLSPPASFDDYADLLESGAYLAQALGDARPWTRR